MFYKMEKSLFKNYSLEHRKLKNLQLHMYIYRKNNLMKFVINNFCSNVIKLFCFSIKDTLFIFQKLSTIFTKKVPYSFNTLSYQF